MENAISVSCEYVSTFPPHLVLVNISPDTSSNLTGKQDDQAGKELGRKKNQSDNVFSTLSIKQNVNCVFVVCCILSGKEIDFNLNTKSSIFVIITLGGILK